MTLGKPYGIQFGGLNIEGDFFPSDVRGKQALDTLIVAHGMNHFKEAINWNQQDIDNVLMLGTELFNETKNVQLVKLKELTKGFVFKKSFIQVTVSEPMIVGKVMTLMDRSVDLQLGLEKFFSQHRYGIVQTPDLDLYIVKNGIFYVFDPRGRETECIRTETGESAVMAFATLDNVYHLILNLSRINIKDPFKICSVTVSNVMGSNNSPEKFTATIGNPSKVFRSNDYRTSDDPDISYLKGNVHLGSKVFEELANKHHLSSAITAMVYAKIDPPNSWSSNILDRVFHFGMELFKGCTEGEPVKNLTIADIPSRFYIGDLYRAGVAIAPFLKRTSLKPSYLSADNPITQALKEILTSTSFRCFLLQIENSTFALWQKLSTEAFYFLDGSQRDLDGNVDLYEGASFLFTAQCIEKLCEVIIDRINKIQLPANATLNIHGVKIFELTKLTEKQQKCKPKLKMLKTECIKPMTAETAQIFEDATSTIDAVAPLLTSNQIMKMREKNPEKPLHRQIADLNSPSLVCTKVRVYEDIMCSVEKKLSAITRKEFPKQTIDLVKAVHSEILCNVMEEELGADNCGNRSNPCKDKCKCGTDCCQLLGNAEKVLLTTDLCCLEQEKEDIMRNRVFAPLNFEEAEDTTEGVSQSHFQKLPDGSAIVRGTKKIFELPLEPKIYNFENLSVLIAISAIVTSTKYSIPTWSPETVDYVIGCGHIMSGVIELNHRMDFYTVNEHKMPKIHIREQFFNLKMEAVTNGLWFKLEKVLRETFNTTTKCIVITSNGSFAVFKKAKFYYLFEYSTCNIVGYRIKDSEFGACCFLRFSDVHSMVRRIYAIHSDVQEQQNFLISQVTISRAVEGEEEDLDYVPFSESQEKGIIDQLRNNQMMRREQRISKLKDTDAKIRAEKERMKKYRDETGQQVPEDIINKDLAYKDSDYNAILNEDEFELEANLPTEGMESFESLTQKYEIMETIHGFEPDEEGCCRIKGSFALQDRMCESKHLKACFFVGVYAVMFAVHHPIESMNFRSVDITLENGLKIFDFIDHEEFLKTKNLLGLIVDTTNYELNVQEFIPKIANTVHVGLCEFFEKHKYGIVQSKTCCFTVVKEKDCFLLLDPYGEPNESSPEGQATWNRFVDLETLLTYCQDKMINDDGEPLFKTHFVRVMSYKATKMPKAGYFLFNTPANLSNVVAKTCQFACDAQDESIEWIYKTKKLPWSRMEARNAMGIERNKSESKWKEFDVEIEQKLFSLWGNIHPNMKIFKEHAGRQFSACCIVALVMAHMYNIDEWDAVLMDSIVAHGHKFFVDTISSIDKKNYQLKIEDFNGICRIDDFKFDVRVQSVVYGNLYESRKSKFNLNRALEFVFRKKNIPGVILQCDGKYLALGNVKNQDYFMFDCQSTGAPLFECNQGYCYVLKCCCLKILVASIILTLNVKCHNVNFHLFAVNSKFSAIQDEPKPKVTFH